MIKRVVAVILFLALSLTSRSQINVSVGWDKDTIDLGGEVDLMLFIKGHPGVKIDSVSCGFLDSLISGFLL